MRRFFQNKKPFRAKSLSPFYHGAVAVGYLPFLFPGLLFRSLLIFEHQESSRRSMIDGSVIIRNSDQPR
jgi:hypothetical protein